MQATVLLVGGSSSVGKTTLARKLATRLGWDAVHVDRMLPRTPAFDPLAGSLNVWDRPSDELRDLLITAGLSSAPLLRAEVERRRAVSARSVLEGERVHPELVASFCPGTEVRGAFVIETDSERLYQTLMGRSRSFRAIDERRRRAVVELDRLYGLWLLEECSKLGLTWVPSQPWDTLADRLIEALKTCAT